MPAAPAPSPHHATLWLAQPQQNRPPHGASAKASVGVWQHWGSGSGAQRDASPQAVRKRQAVRGKQQPGDSGLSLTRPPHLPAACDRADNRVPPRAVPQSWRSQRTCWRCGPYPQQPPQAPHPQQPGARAILPTLTSNMCGVAQLDQAHLFSKVRCIPRSCRHPSARPSARCFYRVENKCCSCSPSRNPTHTILRFGAPQPWRRSGTVSGRRPSCGT